MLADPVRELGAALTLDEPQRQVDAAAHAAAGDQVAVVDTRSGTTGGAGVREVAYRAAHQGT